MLEIVNPPLFLTPAWTNHLNDNERTVGLLMVYLLCNSLHTALNSES